ncbi:MAG: family 10 glycosylhydrolase [Paludibacteraceae bacterium]|nr:family 10 glycosylhydrolase [Paludibacteraceae bacterium]
MRKQLITILTIGLLSTVNYQLSTAQQPFRGAWIATVANIDWPTPEAVGNDSLQQAEMLFLLDSLHSLGINAVIFQVRPTADALYRSDLEPWSHWLTGTQGKQAGYDPLELVVTECHKRGMEVHAWINPFRVNLATSGTEYITFSHIFHQHPDWFWKYGKQWYFNPALPHTCDWICMVVDDIICRYNIDAIHMDDYFYPYPIAKKPLPDAADFARDPRGFSDIRDWRRDNVNHIVQAVSETVHNARPDVQFGISPFGVYKDGTGLTNYHDLYADVLYWIEQGWLDYVLPQLYWHIGNSNADYATLARWWANAVDSINSSLSHDSGASMHHCQLYIGMSPYRLGGAKEPAAWHEGNEIARQIRLNRTIQGIDGECFYSTRPLLSNPLHVCDSIKVLYNE